MIIYESLSFLLILVHFCFEWVLSTQTNDSQWLKHEARKNICIASSITFIHTTRYGSLCTVIPCAQHHHPSQL